MVFDLIRIFLKSCLTHQAVANAIYPAAHLYHVTGPPSVILNLMAQPLFLCVLTPQSVLNMIVFPFFLKACVQHYRKFTIWIMWIAVYGTFVTIYDGVSESLVRHRMAIELFYYAIGVVGICM